MKIEIIGTIAQSLAKSKIGDKAELAGFCRSGGDRQYAIIVLDKNSLFDLVPLHSIKKII